MIPHYIMNNMFYKIVLQITDPKCNSSTNVGWKQKNTNNSTFDSRTIM